MRNSPQQEAPESAPRKLDQEPDVVEEASLGNHFLRAIRRLGSAKKRARKRQSRRGGVVHSNSRPCSSQPFEAVLRFPVLLGVNIPGLKALHSPNLGLPSILPRLFAVRAERYTAPTVLRSRIET